VGAVVGLCLGGASVGTVCVVSGGVPDLGSSQPVRQEARAAPKGAAPKREPVAPAVPAVVTGSRTTARVTTAPVRSRPEPPKTPSPRAKKREAKEAAPREFGFENQPASSEPAVGGAQTTAAAPPSREASQPTQSSKKFSPAEQEFEP
jgi:hypothetical protein